MNKRNNFDKTSPSIDSRKLEYAVGIANNFLITKHLFVNERIIKAAANEVRKAFSAAKMDIVHRGQLDEDLSKAEKRLNVLRTKANEEHFLTMTTLYLEKTIARLERNIRADHINFVGPIDEELNQQLTKAARRNTGKRAGEILTKH